MRHKKLQTALYAVLVLLPFLWVLCILFCNGFKFELSILQPVWNDEIGWYNQVAAVIEYGKPLGYYGYNGTHAQIGTWGAWGDCAAAALCGFWENIRLGTFVNGFGKYFLSVSGDAAVSYYDEAFCYTDPVVNFVIQLQLYYYRILPDFYVGRTAIFSGCYFDRGIAMAGALYKRKKAFFQKGIVRMYSLCAVPFLCNPGVSGFCTCSSGVLLVYFQESTV